MYMDALHLLHNNISVLLSVVALVSLCVGSFLNVVIYRIPIMLQSDRSQATTPQHTSTFNLASPRSHCPHCKTPITWWANIPIVSYCLLSGKSHCCQNTISARYPIIELLCMLLSVYTAYHFGFSWLMLAALLLCWGLIALVVIDIDQLLLPDTITLPLLWLGLLVNAFAGFTDLHSAVVGAMIGYSLFWTIGYAFKTLRGIEGLGHGDYKLLAALGAWLGWQQLPFILFSASLMGALYGLVQILRKQQHIKDPIPFGPFLAFAGLISLFWGHDAVLTYIAWERLYP